jgi:outer membrane protein insertion porin family
MAFLFYVILRQGGDFQIHSDWISLPVLSKIRAYFGEDRRTGGGMAKSSGIGILFLGFLLVGPAAFAQQSDRAKIEDVRIRKNQRIPLDTIMASIVQTRKGEAYEASHVEFDLRSLFKTNFFENIEVTAEDGDTGKIVTFYVKEKPIIRSIEYSGNSSFTESNILDAFKEKKVGLTVDSQYDPAKIRTAERVLKDLMVQNGKPLGVLHTEIENVPPLSVRVRFVMEEGPSVRIGKISFSGPKVFREKELKNALKLNRERNLFSVFKGTDKYHQEKLEYDVETNLRSFYQQHGYMQLQIGQPITRIFDGPRGVIPMLRKTRDQFYIEIPIEAGDQFRIGKLELTNCIPFKCEALVNAFGLKKGDIVDFKKVKDTLEQLKKLYGNLGFINFAYTAVPNIDAKTKTYDLTLNLQPDKQFLVGQIRFSGNRNTKDKVMRREFILEEKKVFSSAALDSSILRLNQLGIFDKIEEKDYEIKPDEPKGLVDVEVKVKEKSQRSIGFQGGVSGISGSFIGLNYSDNNFLGRGESVEMSVTGGTRTTNFLVSFTEPYFFDTRWSLQMSLFNQRYRYDSYSSFGMTGLSGAPTELFTQKSTGGTVSLNRRLGHSLWSFGSSYTYQKIGISDITAGLESFALSQFTGLTPSNQSTDALNGIRRSEITPVVSYNSTNSYFMATRGTSFTVSSAISGGILKGNFSMVRPLFEYRHFIPDKWLSNKHNTFAFRFLGQYIKPYGDSSVPFFDRFFIGGENDIRGFDIRSLSPIAITTTRVTDVYGNPVINLKTGLPLISQSSPFPVGGDMVGVFNFEYRIPIAGPLSMSAFYDMGMVRATDISSLKNFGASHADVEIVDSTNRVVRGSTGLEIQFVLPMIGAPFRLIFAYNPQRLTTDITSTNSVFHVKEPNHDIKFTVGRSF